MEMRKRVLGSEHPFTLTSMATLAITWERKDRDSEATKPREEYVQLRTRVLGIDHPDTIYSSKVLIGWETEVGYLCFRCQE